MHPTTPCMNLVTQAALVFRDVAIIRELCNQVSSQVLLWSKDVELETRRMLRSLEMRLYKRYRARAAQSGQDDYTDIDGNPIRRKELYEAKNGNGLNYMMGETGLGRSAQLQKDFNEKHEKDLLDELQTYTNNSLKTLYDVKICTYNLKQTLQQLSKVERVDVGSIKKVKFDSQLVTAEKHDRNFEVKADYRSVINFLTEDIVCMERAGTGEDDVGGLDIVQVNPLSHQPKVIFKIDNREVQFVMSH